MVSIEEKMLLCRYLNHFSALVLAAARAHTVRELGFVTIRAFGQDRPAQRIVGTAHRGASLGMSSFRIWHRFFSLANAGRAPKFCTAIEAVAAPPIGRR